MAQPEFEYYRRRAEQERTLVRKASNNVAAAAHGVLAAAYTERLSKLAASNDSGDRPG
jgi:hypothetical protein